MLGHLAALGAMWLLAAPATVAATPTAPAPATATATATTTAHTLAPNPSGVLRGVPVLRTFKARESEAAWSSIKAMANPAAQLTAIRRKRLSHTACSDMVDLRALTETSQAPFGFRDTIRGRSWSRPSVALVIFEAMASLRKEFPGRTVTIGDVAQPGCGQLSHGTLVRHLHGDAALALANKARIVQGRPVVIERLRGRHFPAELQRFGSADAPVVVEHEILARDVDKDGVWTLRTASRRYLPSLPGVDRVAEMEALVRPMVSRKKRVDKGTTVTVSARGMADKRWTYHWIDRRARRQLVMVTDSPITLKRGQLDFSQVVELRISKWDRKKPLSFKQERRWRRVGRSDDGAVQWERWQQLYEAGHISHHSGRDADLSYLTVENRRHFAVDYEAIDAKATIRWFELLVARAEKRGLAVEMILVDPAIHRHLKKTLGRGATRSPAWPYLKRSRGHDGHHHIRLRAETDRTERKAKRRLLKLTGKKQSW